MDKGFAAFSTMQSPVMIPFNYSYAALSVNVSLPPRAVPYSHYIGMVPPPPPPPQLLALPAAPASSPETTVSTSGSPTPTRSPSTAMKSFSIEAILGLNSQADAHRQQQQLQYQYPAACHPQYRSLPDITSVYPGHYHQGMHATYPGNLPLSPSNQQQEHHGVFKQQNIAGKANLGAQRRHHRLDVISRSYPQLKTETAAHTPDTKTKDKSAKNHDAETKQGKAKRVRTIFTPDQLERMEQEFGRQQYMVGTERLYLASSLGLSEAQVKVWFQNRRIKWRKQHLEQQHAKLAELGMLSRQCDHDPDTDSDSDCGSSVTEQET